MKELKIIDEQIRQLADGLCGDIKEAVKKAFPEVFEKDEEWEEIIEIGIWNFKEEYFLDVPKYTELVCCLQIRPEKRNRYKFENGKLWRKKDVKRK